MPDLPRPPRVCTSLDPVVRRTILLKGARAGVSEAAILELHREEECYPDVSTMLEQTARRYQLDLDELVRRAVHGANRVSLQLALLPGPDGVLTDSVRLMLIGKLETGSPDWLLYVLPDTEFLTAIETAAADIARRTDFYEQEMAIDDWLAYTDKVLRKNGVPYRLVPEPGAMRFEWIGNQEVHELAIVPAVAALADPRLVGPHDEFSEALAKRRRGAPKDLEDAVDEAAKSVESVLEILHREKAVALPAKRQVRALFNRLSSPDVDVLPGYLQSLILAAGGLRNHMAGHGQGASVRVVSEELADASIGAAAVAITILANYLP